MGGKDGCRGSAKGGIPAGAMIPKTRHSRESGNLETFAMGRLALAGRPWVLGPRWGSGSWNDGGAVDSRFHGNDRWAAMAVGEDDGRAGMVERGNDG